MQLVHEARSLDEEFVNRFLIIKKWVGVGTTHYLKLDHPSLVAHDDGFIALNFRVSVTSTT